MWFKDHIFQNINNLRLNDKTDNYRDQFESVVMYRKKTEIIHKYGVDTLEPMNSSPINASSNRDTASVNRLEACMSDTRDVQNEQDKSSNDSASSEAADNNVEIESGDVQTTDEQVEFETSEEIIAALEAELAAANATIEGQKEGVLRARADMENAIRRAEAEVAKARKFALERFAGELLPVADNLERAIQVADAENEAVKPLLEGVELTLKSFLSTIEKFDLVVIDPQGDTFNPELHQAMSMQESADVAPNTVIAVMQKGYQINGRLLRPAMVMVSRAPDGGVDTQV